MSDAPVLVWRIGTDTPDYEADDATGQGAKSSGGRWNRKGQPVLYAASTRALACLETLVHFRSNKLPFNRYLVEISIPAKVWKNATRVDAADLIGWDASPPGKVSLDWGDAWLASETSAVALVPSIVVPEEFCVLVNPRHPDAGSIAVRKVRRWAYDARLKQ